MVNVLRRKGAVPFIECIIQGKSQTEAARAAGVTRTTACLRLQDPDWIAAINAERDRIFTEARDKLNNRLGEAIDRVGELMHSDGGTSVQLNAARTFLEYASKYRPEGEITTVNSNVTGRAELDLSDEAIDIIRGLGIGGGREVPVDGDPGDMPDVELPDPQ